MIRIHILTCGEVGVDPAVPDRGVSRNRLAYTGLLRSPKRRIWLPVKAFLIEHPQGRILVDTGWDSAVRDHPVRTLTFPMWFASKPRLPAGAAADEQLAALGLAPKDLRYVLMTHMDIDHDSGLRLVRDARQILVSPEEWLALCSGQVRYARRPWKDIPLGLMPLEDDPAAPFGRSWDVFGDGSVLVFLTPGHTQGSVSIRVSGANGFALLVGDTGYNRASWESLRLPGPVFDPSAMRASLAWVQRMRQEPDCLAVLAAHDPEETRSILELQEAAKS
jgi:N-acyl homoserine lactone hydrolase